MPSRPLVDQAPFYEPGQLRPTVAKAITQCELGPLHAPTQSLTQREISTKLHKKSRFTPYPQNKKTRFVDPSASLAAAGTELRVVSSASPAQAMPRPVSKPRHRTPDNRHASPSLVRVTYAHHTQATSSRGSSSSLRAPTPIHSPSPTRVEEEALSNNEDRDDISSSGSEKSSQLEPSNVVELSSETELSNLTEFSSDEGSDQESEDEIPEREEKHSEGDDRIQKEVSRLPIKKPKGEVSRPGRGGYNLLKALKWRKADLKRIMKYVKNLITENLDITSSYSKQSLADIQYILEQTEAKFPIIQTYEEAWPVSDIIRQQLKYMSGREKIKEAKEDAQTGKRLRNLRARTKA